MFAITSISALPLCTDLIHIIRKYMYNRPTEAIRAGDTDGYLMLSKDGVINGWDELYAAYETGNLIIVRYLEKTTVDYFKIDNQFKWNMISSAFQGNNTEVIKHALNHYGKYLHDDVLCDKIVKLMNSCEYGICSIETYKMFQSSCPRLFKNLQHRYKIALATLEWSCNKGIPILVNWLLQTEIKTEMSDKLCKILRLMIDRLDWNTSKNNIIMSLDCAIQLNLFVCGCSTQLNKQNILNCLFKIIKIENMPKDALITYSIHHEWTEILDHDDIFHYIKNNASAEYQTSLVVFAACNNSWSSVIKLLFKYDLNDYELVTNQIKHMLKHCLNDELLLFVVTRCNTDYVDSVIKAIFKRKRYIFLQSYFNHIQNNDYDTLGKINWSCIVEKYHSIIDSVAYVDNIKKYLQCCQHIDMPLAAVTADESINKDNLKLLNMRTLSDAYYSLKHNSDLISELTPNIIHDLMERIIYDDFIELLLLLTSVHSELCASYLLNELTRCIRYSSYKILRWLTHHYADDVKKNTNVEHFEKLRKAGKQYMGRLLFSDYDW